MAVTPTGDPPWIKTSTNETYGGHQNKEDYQSQGVVNPLTDVGADQFARLTADQAACTRVASFCKLTLTMDDTGTNDPTVDAIDQMTGVRLTSYGGATPPSGFPSATRNGDGDVTIQWDASYADEYGVSDSLSIEHMECSVHGSTAALAVLEQVDSRTVRLRVFDTSGAAETDRTVTVEVCP